MLLCLTDLFLNKSTGIIQRISMENRHREISIQTVPVIVHKKVERLNIAPGDNSDHKTASEAKIAGETQILTILKHIIT